MEQLLEIRELIKYNFSKYEKIINGAIKFIINLAIYLWIFSFGMYSDIFSRLFEGSTQAIYITILSILGIFLPLPYIYFLVAINVFIQLSSYFVFSLFLFLIMLGIVLLYSRVAVNESILVFLTFVGLLFNVPFVAPIIAGIYFGITAFIPLILGCMLYSCVICFKEYLIMVENNPVIQDIGIDSLMITFEHLTRYITKDNNFISYIIILVGAFFIIKIIEKLNLNYDKYISSAISFGYFIVAYIITKVVFNLDYSFFGFIIGLILSAIILVVVLYFDTILDYSKTKFIKFEDRENMYYVKVVPKIFLKKDE